MRTMTKSQLFHFILSFNERTLRTWYNEVMVDPFGDFREQTIRDYTEEEENELKNELSLEVLCEIMRNKKTAVWEEDKYIMVDGADRPYIITFSTFEEFLSKHEYICTYLKEDAPELLDELKREEK